MAKECDVCGRELHKDDRVYYDVLTEGEYEVFCSKDCFREHVRKNLGDYIEIIEDEVLDSYVLRKEDQ